MASLSTKPTDQDILDTIARGDRMMTYAIRNVLGRKYAGLKTDWVRRRLMALEKAGKVKRVPTAFVSQICWVIAESGAQ